MTDALVCAIMPAFAPPPDLAPSQWSEEHRRLPASSPSRGARWSNKTAPYLVEIMDAGADPSVRRLVIMGGSQTGKSEVVHNLVGYWIEHDPSTVLWIMPSFDDAKRRSRGALSDMIRSTPALRSVVRGRRAPRSAHESESTLLEKVYPGGSLILAGSGTPNSFAGVSARRAVADDFERFEILKEGDPATLLSNRITAFYDGLLVFISTPLLVDGLIHSQFKTTDQRRLHLLCTCGREDFVTWNDPEHFRVAYQGDDPDTARLECSGCGKRHDETARRQLVAAGRWKPTTKPVDHSSRGYHVPATISTLGDVTLSRLVQKWLTARASGPMALMSFVTTTLAEPWEDRGGRVDPTGLAMRREDYGPDVDAPEGVICLTAGVDVQIDRFEISVYGWGRGLESWLVDHRIVPGDPSQAQVQAALLTGLDERYRHALGHNMPVLATAVDAGYLPDRVAYRLAERRPRRIYATKGVGGKFGEPSILKYDPRKPPAALNVDGLKLEIHLALEMAAPGPGYLHLSRACDEEFLSQLTAEHRETKRKSGVATLVWVEDRTRNEALDCAVYARAALKLLARVSGARTEDSMLVRMAELAAKPPPDRDGGGKGSPSPPPRSKRGRVGRSGYIDRSR